MRPFVEVREGKGRILNFSNQQVDSKLEVPEMADLLLEWHIESDREEAADGTDCDRSMT